MDTLLRALRTDFPHIIFEHGQILKWSPHTSSIACDPKKNDPAQQWGLFHELGHALLKHLSYTLDIELLGMEIAAWDYAKYIAPRYEVIISNEHIEHCLDSYRDWLHKRSTCPACGMHGIQHRSTLYTCLNCPKRWNVSSSRFCRAYRY